MLALALSVGIFTFLWGCGNDRALADNSTTAVIYSTSNPSNAIGEANFTTTDTGLDISVILNQAPPGEHGFHIHEVGSCDDGGNAAKGHFNPEDVKHGYLPQDGFDSAHAGDLGNITVAANGTGSLDLAIAGLTLDEGERAVRGHSVILHENNDDLTSQPTGNAGGRIGCGIIDSTGT